MLITHYGLHAALFNLSDSTISVTSSTMNGIKSSKGLPLMKQRFSECFHRIQSFNLRVYWSGQISKIFAEESNNSLCFRCWFCSNASAPITMWKSLV